MRVYTARPCGGNTWTEFHPRLHKLRSRKADVVFFPLVDQFELVYVNSYFAAPGSGYRSASSPQEGKRSSLVFWRETIAVTRAEVSLLGLIEHGAMGPEPCFLLELEIDGIVYASCDADSVYLYSRLRSRSFPRIVQAAAERLRVYPRVLLSGNFLDSDLSPLDLENVLPWEGRGVMLASHCLCRDPRLRLRDSGLDGVSLVKL